MKSLVVYDSKFGNTKTIAEAIAAQLRCPALLVDNVRKESLAGIGLLIVGSPIHAWRPTPKIKAFLKGIGPGKLRDVFSAAFDTRVRSFMSGNAAKRISASLEKSGASIISLPQAFYVKGNEGPLEEGELDRADSWARILKSGS